MNILRKLPIKRDKVFLEGMFQSSYISFSMDEDLKKRLLQRHEYLNYIKSNNGFNETLNILNKSKEKVLSDFLDSVDKNE